MLGLPGVLNKVPAGLPEYKTLFLAKGAFFSNLKNPNRTVRTIAIVRFVFLKHSKIFSYTFNPSHVSPGD